MTGTGYLGGKIMLIVFLLASPAFSGCEGSDSREEVDSAVEEFAGKKKVEQMKAMEKNAGEIQDQQSDRLKQLNDIK